MEGFPQLAGYLKEAGGKYGILTDSESWFLIKVHPTLKRYQLIYAHMLFRNETRDRKFLMQLSKGRIKSFLVRKVIIGLPVIHCGKVRNISLIKSLNFTHTFQVIN